MNIFCDDPCVTCKPIPPGAEGIFPNPNAEANPFSNFSSEKPDRNIFIGHRINGLGDPPILDGVFQSTGCIGICFSTVSQEAADICAYNQEVLCTSVEWPVDVCVVLPDLCKEPDICVIRPDLCRPRPRPVFTNDDQSCTVNCPDGTPFSLVVNAGTFLGFSRAEANAIARSYACNQARLQRICLSSLSPAACCTSQPYSGDISVTGSSGETFAFTVESGFLPIGFTLEQIGPSTARISGTTITPGTFSFAIRATGGVMPIMRQYVIRIVGISTASLPAGQVGVPYSQTLSAQPPPVDPAWSVVTGSLPNGLALDAESGEISGTPTTKQTSPFTIQLATAGINCTRNYTLTVACAQAAQVTTMTTVIYPDIPACPPTPGNEQINESHLIQFNNTVDLYEIFPIILMWDGNCPPEPRAPVEYTGGHLVIGPYSQNMRVFAASTLKCDDFFTVRLNSVVNPVIYESPHGGPGQVPYGTCLFDIPAGSTAIIQAFEEGGAWCYVAGKLALLTSDCMDAAADTCAMFEDTPWPAPTIATSGNGVASGTFSGNDIQASASVGAFTGIDNSASVDIEANTTHQGPGIQCCLQITAQGGSGGGFSILIEQDLTPLLFVTESSGGPGQYAFTMAESCAPSAIKIVISCSASSQAESPDAKSISFTAILGAC